jgi:predicted NBD/HSP70 family sugar kinase
VLSLVRRFGNLPKAEIARLTGLSAQTVSVIVKALEGDGLLLRMAPNRGRIGQPSVPLNLNPEGALSFGLKIGRRSASLMMMDFVGTARGQISWSYLYPDLKDILASVETTIATLTGKLTKEQKSRIAGLGVAVPFELWNWGREVGAPLSTLEAWKTCDLQAELEHVCGWPVSVSNDATAACGAELTFGKGHAFQDFVYIFIGYFAGGGLVLGGNLYPGRQGNAGALGSMPVLRRVGDKGNVQTQQLILSASLHRLEQRLAAKNIDPAGFFKSPQWDQLGPILDDWLDEAAAGLAHAIVASMSVIDFGGVIIDGGFPSHVRSQLVALTREKVMAFDLQGLSPFEIIEGSVGANARTVGAASLPFFSRFLLDRDVLFKGEG